MKDVYNSIRIWYCNLSIIKKINYANVLTIMIPIILLAYFANRLSSEIIIDKTINNSIQDLRIVIQSLDGILNETTRMSNIIIVNNDVQNAMKDSKFMDESERIRKAGVISAFIDSVLYPMDTASSCVMYGNSNYNISSNNVDISNIKSRNDKFLQPHKQNERWIGLHAINYEKWNDKINCISLNKNITDGGTGNYLGTLEMNIDEKTISKSYSQLKYGDTGLFFIAESNGNIISSENKGDIYSNISKEVYFPATQKNTPSGSVFKINGEKYLVTSGRYERNQWIVVSIVPLSELTSDNNKVTKMIYLTGVICILFGMIFSVFISRAVSRPIIRLSKYMGKVGIGDFKVDIPHEGNDEVGVLTDSFNNMTSKISDLVDQVYIEQKRKRVFELQALQSQINPHFLYNTLESICSLVQMNLNKDAYRMVKALAMFYRRVLSKGKNVISISEEINIIENYFIIQKIRYGDKFEYDININEKVMNGKIIKLSIQPIVENAIYHGVREKQGKGNINITGEVEGENIVISIIDDGAGMSEIDINNICLITEKNVSGKPSFGLKSVNERIKLYFGQEYGIRITSKEGIGTRIDIILPFSFEGELDY